MLARTLLALACLLPTPQPSTKPRAAGDEPLTAAQQEFLDRLVELCRSAPTPTTPPQGDGTVEGAVETVGGAPLGGVEVRLVGFPDHPPTFERSPFDPVEEWNPDPAAALATQLERDWRRACATDRQFVLTTTSDEHGRFRFDHLPRRPVQLDATHPGFAVMPIGAFSSHATIDVVPDAEVTLIARPLLRVPLVVRLPDGGEPPLARIEFERIGSNGFPLRQSWSPESRDLLLHAGDWQVTARLPMPPWSHSVAGPGWNSETRNVHVGAESVEPVELLLKPVRVIVGSIRHPIADVASRFEVAVRRLRDDEDAASAEFAEAAARARGSSPAQPSREVIRRGANVDDYWIGPLEPGRWLLVVTDRANRREAARSEVQIGDDPVVRNFEVRSDAEREESVAIRVVDAHGAPLADCRFDLATQSIDAAGRTGGTSIGSLTLERLAAGRFALPRSRLRDRNWIAAVHPRFGTVVAEVAPGAADLELRFVEPAVVTLRLEHFAERADDRLLTLELEPADGDPASPLPRRLRHDAMRLAAGSIDLGALQPGRWRARVEAAFPPELHRAGHAILENEWTLAAGPAEVSLELPALTTLQVTRAAAGIDPPSATRLRLVPVGWSRGGSTVTPLEQSAGVDRNGAVEFADVAAGRWRLEREPWGTMWLDLPTERPVAFTPVACRAKWIELTSSEGAFAKAGLRTGDLLVAIDGREFESAREFTQCLDSVAPDHREATTCTVQRLDDRFEISLPFALLADPARGGGRLIDPPPR